MKIVIGSDHRGDAESRTLLEHLRANGYDAEVLGECGEQSRDYPDSAWLVGQAVHHGDADRGVLICGSGIGMSIAANKVPGVRAALANSLHAAEMSRRHNDANVLCMSADAVSTDEVVAIIDRWLTTEFEGGRHARRVDKMAAIERGVDPATISADAAKA